MIGERFGRLVVREQASSAKSGGTRWHCVCDCGAETVSPAKHLRSGSTRSCGCLMRELLRAKARPDAKHKHPLYQVWLQMVYRCTSPGHQSWHKYGGRGITVCDRWSDSFEAFLSDMGPRPAGMSIERKDNDGPYAPSNCRWATPAEQALNTRRSRLVTVRGETKPLTQWARDLGLPAHVLRGRMRYRPIEAVVEEALA